MSAGRSTFEPILIFLFNFILCVRYAACLLSGMRPELVLNEDKKKKRFWKKIGKLFYVSGNSQKWIKTNL